MHAQAFQQYQRLIVRVSCPRISFISIIYNQSHLWSYIQWRNTWTFKLNAFISKITDTNNQFYVPRTLIRRKGSIFFCLNYLLAQIQSELGPNSSFFMIILHFQIDDKHSFHQYLLSIIQICNIYLFNFEEKKSEKAEGFALKIGNWKSKAKPRNLEEPYRRPSPQM